MDGCLDLLTDKAAGMIKMIKVTLPRCANSCDSFKETTGRTGSRRRGGDEGWTGYDCVAQRIGKDVSQMQWTM